MSCRAGMCTWFRCCSTWLVPADDDCFILGVLLVLVMYWTLSGRRETRSLLYRAFSTRSGFIYSLGVTTTCLLMLETWTGTSIKIHSCQAGGFRCAEGDSLDDPTHFDRHLLIFWQLLSSFNVSTNEAEGVAGTAWLCCFLV